MNREEMLSLLSELIACHSPSGDEKEIDAVLAREFQATGADVWTDDTGNVCARLPGDGLRVMVCAHKDEIAMIVTEVEADGRLRVTHCGGASPWKYGEGPVDLIADDGRPVRGVLSVGSVHTTTGPIPELDKTRALTWDLVSIFTGLDPAGLDEIGVHVGSRAVVARERKAVQRLGDYVASFALDDRMGLTVLIAALNELAQATGRSGDVRPDLYFVATHGEETGMLGGVRAGQLIRPDLCVAIDTAPVAHGTPLVVDARPVIWYVERSHNSKAECDRLLGLSKELGFGAQAVVNPSSGSDAGRLRLEGLAGRTVCFGPGRDNSHGFEIAHAGSLVNVTRLLVRYLTLLE